MFLIPKYTTPVDIDECAEQSPCDPSATCTNTPGSYSCSCDEGYTGNGTTCSGKPNTPAFFFHSLF